MALLKPLSGVQIPPGVLFIEEKHTDKENNHDSQRRYYWSESTTGKVVTA